jgi:hypothetical protein
LLKAQAAQHTSPTSKEGREERVKEDGKNEKKKKR